MTEIQSKFLQAMFGDARIALKLLSGNKDFNKKDAPLKELKLLYDNKKFD